MNRTHESLRLTAIALAMSSVAACTTPQNNAQLDQARSAVATVSADPTVNRDAPLELQRAREALGRAESAWSGGADQDEVSHEAYLAAQQAALASETAKLRSTMAQIQSAEADRTKVLLSAREQELQALRAQSTTRGQVVTLSNVLFATGSANLAPGASSSLDNLASFLQRNPDYSVQVEGYTDSTGSDAHNLTLSQQRADAVRAALVQRGVDPRRVTSVGLGESAPVASNDTREGRQSNRRVEIVLNEPGGQPTASGAPAGTRTRIGR